MKTVSIVIALLLASDVILCQTPYYDAVALKPFAEQQTKNIIINIDNNNLSIIAPILLKYIHYDTTKIKDSNTLYDIIKNSLKLNPFLNISGNIQNDLNGKALSNSIRQSSNLSSAFPQKTIGGLDVTTLANGMANFMIKRAKEELTISFFNHFKKFTDDNPEVKILFPKTAESLEKLLNIQYPRMLSLLRESFNEDLKNLPNNISDILLLPKYQLLYSEFPEIKITIQSLRLLSDLKTGQVLPAEIIKQLAELKEWNDTCTSKSFINLKSTIKLSAILSESLRYKYSSKRWISTQDFNGLVKDSIAFKIYLGLVYQELNYDDSIKFSINNKTIFFAEIMKNQKDNLFLFQVKLSQLISLTEEMNIAITDIKTKKDNQIKITNDDYYRYINTAIDILDFCNGFAYNFDRTLTHGDDYILLARKSNDLFKYCANEEYALAIFAATDLLSRLDAIIKANEQVKSKMKKFGIKEGQFDKEKLQKAAKDISDKNIQEDTTYLYSICEFDKFTELISQINNFGLFMANMVLAKTSEEAQTAIENAVLPVGSSSIKKNSRCNIALQSYLGGFYQLKSTSQENTSWNNEFGLHGPIGFSFSHRINWWKFKGSSISLFASVFDLGAIIDYKLTRDTISTSGTTSQTNVVQKDTKITLGQIVSPGIFLVYGFPLNMPLSLGVGTQYGPGLSKISQGGINVINNPSWRPCIFLSVDIPLLNLYNKPH